MATYMQALLKLENMRKRFVGGILWSCENASAKQPDFGKFIDDIMHVFERYFSRLLWIRPKGFTRTAMDEQH